ncbi:tumor necrosis factor receptor superfamily member 14 isoform X2 [Cavia porcellus]|uniref:tumor necrosis factor receptor superfamily member 14 isoform X2 n=1 Tax=Cavia porcellus TaxID=10141 RepID=UPI000661BB61|nr:tumor necrosis factor receptor superfamily member 14 isoform X2 [Cavia porcellus]
MGALPGWGRPYWHPGPEANTLRLALCLLLLGSPQHTPAQPACRQEEFPVGLECCPKCGPGMGLVTRRKCSSTQDTVCDCIQGHFCKAQEGDHCVLCEPHSTCLAGQRVKERGTSSQDTLCADCPPGTFSPNGTLDQCLPWTRCSWFQREVEPSTSSEDVTCSLSGLISGLCVTFFLLGLSLVIWIWKKRKRSLGFGASMTSAAQGQKWGGAEEPEVTEVLQACPDVTTVAVEETAMCRESDPHR